MEEHEPVIRIAEKSPIDTIVLPKDEGTLADAEAIISIADKSPLDHAALPEDTRLALMTALGKLKMTFQTPVEATTELFEGVRILIF